MLTKQANDSWRACFVTRTPPRGAGIKGERVQTHISFSLRSRAIAVSRVSARQASVGVTARQRRSLSSADSFKETVTLLPPLGASALLKGRLFTKEQSKRAPRVTGVFLKMASRSCVSGCGRFLTSSDGHDRCPSCLGFKHAEAALVDESCSHCGNMTMAMLRSRYLLARRGVSPLLCPVLVPPAGGLLRLRARVTEDYSESFPVEYASAGLSLLQHIAPSGVPG